MRQWHYTERGTQKGPVSEDDLLRLFQSGELALDTLIWSPGLPKWLCAHDPASPLPRHLVPPPPLHQPGPRPDYDPELLERIAGGRRLALYATLVYIGAMILAAAAGPVLAAVCGWASLAAMLMAAIGIYRLASGLGNSLLGGCGIFLLVFVPLISLIILLILNNRATALLRANGYSVGLLGAWR